MKPIQFASANSVIEQRLREYLTETETFFKADAIAIFGNLYYGIEDQVRSAIENKPKKKRSLVVLLETSGGYIEVAQRIADTFRRHYRTVDFIVPSFAMSAGTVLVMSGDAIYMDYFSVLGPIDPQVQKGEVWVPALGYLRACSRSFRDYSHQVGYMREVVLGCKCEGCL